MVWQSLVSCINKNACLFAFLLEYSAESTQPLILETTLFDITRWPLKFLGLCQRSSQDKRAPTQPVIVSSYYFVQMGLGTKPMCKRKTVRYLRHNGRGLLVSTGQPQYIPISRNRPPFIDSAIHSLTDLILLLLSVYGWVSNRPV